MADGTGRLGGGAQQLADGLTDGATQIPDDTDAQRTARADALATPVAIDDEDVAPAASLGEGFAPLFIPLALFVGGLITWLLLRPLPTRALATPASGWRVALAGYLPSLVIGAGQVVLLLGVVGLGLGLSIGHPVGTVAFLLLVAATFLAVQQMLHRPCSAPPRARSRRSRCSCCRSRRPAAPTRSRRRPRSSRRSTRCCP